MDTHTPEQRRRNMSRIRSKNTQPERELMKALRNKGLWFTHHRTDIIGKPDIVFKRKKVAVFIDSAFWHGKGNLPINNRDYWVKKLERNRQRDAEVNSKLSEQGWTILRFSDSAIKKNLDDCVNEIFVALRLNVALT